MKTEKNIFIAFILNFGFSIFEFIGGIFTGSVAIMSDSIHDMGDAVAIGISYVFEKISHKEPDEKYTFGYKRFSVVGSLITTIMLITGSFVVIYNAVCRIISPTVIDYNGMIILSIIGVVVNLVAAFFTHGGHSRNEKAVNIHMLEDVFGWIVVLVGAVVMRFTEFSLIDQILSISVSLFIFLHAVRHLFDDFAIFVEKVPQSINVTEIKKSVLDVEGVIDVKELRVLSIDGVENYSIIKIECNKENIDLSNMIKEIFGKHGVGNICVEIEKR